MTTLAEIWVAVHPDTAKTGVELNTKLSKVDTSKSGKKAGADYSKGFGSGIKSLIGLAGGALAALGVKNFLKDATTGYRDHLKVAAVTTQAIKTTGGAAKITATQVGDLSDAIERKTGVDGDAIQSGANLLLTFTNVRNEAGKGNKIFDQSAALLADMSVALGQDAKGSAIQLGKALNDPIKGVTALSKVGVSFTDQQKKQIKALQESGNILGAQKIILKELGKEFGGAAAAAADPADRAVVSYHQLQDQIGAGTLPVVNALASSFADFLAPALLDIAEKYGPKVSAFFADLAPNITASLGVLLTGDFNGRIGKALGGLSEDSPYVIGLLRAREYITGIFGSLKLLATGDYTGRIFGKTEDSGYVDFLFNVREKLQGVYEMFRLMITGDFRGKLFGQSEDSGFVDFLFNARTEIGQLAQSAKNFDWSSIKAQLGDAATSVGQLLPLVVEFKQQLPSITSVVNVGASALGFLADHTDELRKLMPLLVGAFIAYKAAQAAANAAALLAVPIKVAEIIANRQLATSNRALIASRAQLAVATTGETAATAANTGAKNVGILTSIRQRIVTLAAAATQKAVAAATAIWTGAQWLLNVALTANPIGLVVVGIGLLIGAVVLIATKTTWFQTIWKVAWGAIQTAVSAAFNWVKKNWPLILAILTGPVGVAVLVISKHWTAIKDAARAALKFVVDRVFDFAQNILDGAAKAFGWVPGIGGKLKGAQAAFATFRDGVNNKLAGITDQKVAVTAELKSWGTPELLAAAHGRAAGGPGGPVDGPGTTTSDTAGLYALSRKEWVIKAKSSMKYGDYAMKSVNDGTATIIPNGGFATGGRPGLTVRSAVPSNRDQVIAANNVATSVRYIGLTVARTLAKNLAKAGVNPGLAKTVAWGKSQAGKPYGWGASGPNAYDCSGFVSALINYAKGHSPYSRLGATGSMPWSSFGSGRGPFMVGWFKGNPGHTAATINGVNFESAGGVGVRYGKGARGADSSMFTNRMKVKGFASGGRPGREGRDGDLPFDLVSRHGKQFLGKKQLAQLGIKTYDQGGRWPTGTLGANLSGKTETVVPDDGQIDLSPRSIDALARALAKISLTLDGHELNAAVAQGAMRRGY